MAIGLDEYYYILAVSLYLPEDTSTLNIFLLCMSMLTIGLCRNHVYNFWNVDTMKWKLFWNWWCLSKISTIMLHSTPVRWCKVCFCVHNLIYIYHIPLLFWHFTSLNWHTTWPTLSRRFGSSSKCHVVSSLRLWWDILGVICGKSAYTTGGLNATGM